MDSRPGGLKTRTRIPMLLAMMAAPGLASAGQPAAEDQESVVDVSVGNVAQGGDPLAPGSRVNQARPISVGEKSWLAIVTLPTCRRTILEGPGTFRLTAGRLLDDNGKEQKGSVLTMCAANPSSSGTMRRLTRTGAVVVRGDDPNVAAKPHVVGLPGTVLDPRPTLAVVIPGKTDASGTLTLREAGGGVVATSKFSGSAALVPFPESAAPLVPGHTYVAEIEVSGQIQRAALRTPRDTDLKQLARWTSDLGAVQGTPSLLLTRVLAERGYRADVLAGCVRTKGEGDWKPLCEAVMPKELKR